MTDRLVLPAAVRNALFARARDGAPEEVCGVLVGDADADGDERPIRVHEASPVENVADDPRTRYELDPAATLAAIDAGEAAGEGLVGFYHTHPRGPAEPSATDRTEAAWPGRVYCIVVPGDGGGGDGETDAAASGDAGGAIRAWRWTGEAFDPLPIEIGGEGEGGRETET